MNKRFLALTAAGMLYTFGPGGSGQLGLELEDDAVEVWTPTATGHPGLDSLRTSY